MSSFSISSFNVRRRDPCAISCGRPIASNTWDGSSDPDVHADPLDAQIPFISSLIRSDSPSTNWKLKLALFGGGLFCVRSDGSMGFHSELCNQIISDFSFFSLFFLPYSLLHVLLQFRFLRFPEHSLYLHDVFLSCAPP